MSPTAATVAIDSAALFAPAPVPVWLLGVVCAISWRFCHRRMLRKQRLPLRALAWLLGCVLGSVTAFAALRILGSYVLLASPWPLWLLAVMAGAGIETLMVLYAFERESLARGPGMLLTACRAAGLALIVLLLAQPVYTWNLERLRERIVAVCVDDSASMRRPDFCLSRTESLRLARLLGMELPFDSSGMDETRVNLDDAAHAMATVKQRLRGASRVPAALRSERFEAHRDEDALAIAGARDAVTNAAAFLAALAAPGSGLSPPLQARAQALRTRLSDLAAGPMQTCLVALRDTPPGQLQEQADALQEAAAGALDGLTGMQSDLAVFTMDIETFRYLGLPESTRAEIDRVTRDTRLTVANRLLTGEGLSGVRGLLPALRDSYTVHLYRFASSASAVDRARWATNGEGAHDNATHAHNATDIGTAVRAAIEDIPREKLAGIVLLTDGLHNGPDGPESVAGLLRTRQIPVDTVLVGGTQDPPDAAVAGVDAPASIEVNDQALFRVSVQLDRMQGRKARVSLQRDGTELAASEITASSDTFRSELTFTDKPPTLGPQAYTVAVTEFDDEILTANNARTVHVSVLQHAVTFLMVEHRPRWEFRYIKNLFLRDFNTIRMQHVLLRPDRIEGIPPPPQVPASASRPRNQTEATAVPASPEEWMKFDVIFLGDVPPGQLGSAGIDALRNYVNRGGTLVVIAGENDMPRSYLKTGLADLIPVTMDSAGSPAGANRFPDGFTITRTAEGLAHVILRQDDRRDRDKEIWSRFPRLYWRLPVTGTKPGATVLAYAMPRNLPDFFDPATTATGAAEEERNRRRRAFQRANPLLVTARYGGGRVLLLCTDRMWRLRFDAGDIYHHKFWGQVIRWASPDPLQAGTRLVRMGTDKLEYRPAEAVRVSATVATGDEKPVMNGDVQVSVFADDAPVTTRKMDASSWRDGMYECTIDGLEADRTYRLVLGGESVAAALSEENVEQPVEMSVRFAAQSGPETQVLAADSTFVRVLASVSDGTLVDPAGVGDVLEHLPEGTRVLIEQQQYPLWTWWPLFVSILACFSVEWMVRKRMGLT